MTDTNADTTIDIPWFSDPFKNYSTAVQWSMFALAYTFGITFETMINIK